MLIINLFKNKDNLKSYIEQLLVELVRIRTGIYTDITNDKIESKPVRYWRKLALRHFSAVEYLLGCLLNDLEVLNKEGQYESNTTKKYVAALLTRDDNEINYSTLKVNNCLEEEVRQQNLTNYVIAEKVENVYRNMLDDFKVINERSLREIVRDYNNMFYELHKFHLHAHLYMAQNNIPEEYAQYKNSTVKTIH